MPKLLIVAVCLIAVGLSLTAYGGREAKAGIDSIVGESQLWIAELCTPRLGNSKFQALLANKETALSTIERVDFVDTNYVGKYLSVKLRGDSNDYHVRPPKICSVGDPYSLDEVKRLNSFGISVGFYFECI